MLSFKKPARVVIIATMVLVATLSIWLFMNVLRNVEDKTLTFADFEKVSVGINHRDVHKMLGKPSLSGLWGDSYELDDGTKAIIYYDDFGNVECVNIQ